MDGSKRTHVFMFADLLLFTRAPSMYQTRDKHQIIEQFDMHEVKWSDLPSDVVPYAFAVTDLVRNESYILQALSQQDKDAWVADIQHLLGGDGVESSDAASPLINKFNIRLNTVPLAEAMAAANRRHDRA